MNTNMMYLEQDMILVEQMVKKAKVAVKGLEKYSQEQVDNLLKVMAKAVADNAVELSQEAVEETGMGYVPDKIEKNTNGPIGLYLHLKGKKSVGEIGRDPERGLVYYAKPKGVVAAVIPTTNPVVTPIVNALMAVKGRNAIILAPHPRAKVVSAKTVRFINEALKKVGAPDNLVQIIEEPTIESTNYLMQLSNVIVATGGSALVKAAYSSGKPAYGVGQGNVQVIVDRDADLELVAKNSVLGRAFDLGVICAGEQSIIAPKEMNDKLMQLFVEHGAYYVTDEPTVDKFRSVLFPERKMDPNIVGLPAPAIAEKAGVQVPPETKVIILKPQGKGKDDLLCKEKMCPVMINLTYDTWEEAVDIAKANLEYEGIGHSTGLYSNNEAHIAYAANELPVGRVPINQVTVFVAGAPWNGFEPTSTLGCGAWGGNSISENLSYRHLIDITTVGYLLDVKAPPSPEEIWK